MWSFDWSLLCLTKYNKKLTPHQVSFERELMWVQLHGLPFGMMNMTFGNIINILIGEVVDIDVDQDGIGWGLFL